MSFLAYYIRTTILIVSCNARESYNIFTYNTPENLFPPPRHAVYFSGGCRRHRCVIIIILCGRRRSVVVYFISAKTHDRIRFYICVNGDYIIIYTHWIIYYKFIPLYLIL